MWRKIFLYSESWKSAKCLLGAPERWAKRPPSFRAQSAQKSLFCHAQFQSNNVYYWLYISRHSTSVKTVKYNDYKIPEEWEKLRLIPCIFHLILHWKLDFRYLQTYDNSRQRRSGEFLASKSEGILLKNMDEKTNHLFWRKSIF